nr:GntR family transcriptional regulator [Eggerthella hominis]
MKNRLVYLISSGYYRPGDKLPTVRDLAIKLKINYNTVNKVYQSLLHDGYLMAHRGRGTFVCDIAQPDAPKEDSPADNVIDIMIKQCLDLGVPIDDIPNQVSKRVARRRGADAPVQEGEA